MEVETGLQCPQHQNGCTNAGYNGIPWRELLYNPFRDYHGRSVGVKGVARFPVQCEGQRHQLLLVIVEGDLPILLGRNWLEVMELNWKNICTIQANLTSDVPRQSVEEVLKRHSAVFEERIQCHNPSRTRR